MKSIFVISSIILFSFVTISSVDWTTDIDLYLSEKTAILTGELEQLTFPVVVVDIRDQVAANPAHTITRKDLFAWEEQHGQIPQRSLVFLYTGWRKEWGLPDPRAGGELRYPACDGAVTRFLKRERNVTGVGIDRENHYVSEVEVETDHIFTWIFAGVVLENLTNLDQLPPTGATVRITALKRARFSMQSVLSVKASIPFFTQLVFAGKTKSS